MQKDTEEIASKNVYQQNFDRFVFKDKLEVYHNFVRSKLSESDSEQRAQ
jgi:hypothetical protein